jgi:hypothetical protein
MAAQNTGTSKRGPMPVYPPFLFTDPLSVPGDAILAFRVVGGEKQLSLDWFQIDPQSGLFRQTTRTGIVARSWGEFKNFLKKAVDFHYCEAARCGWRIDFPVFSRLQNKDTGVSAKQKRRCGVCERGEPCGSFK